jgi:hypothetical protein
MEMAEGLDTPATSPAFLAEYQKSAKKVEEQGSQLKKVSIVVGAIASLIIINTTWTFMGNLGSMMKFQANKQLEELQLKLKPLEHFNEKIMASLNG